MGRHSWNRPIQRLTKVAWFCTKYSLLDLFPLCAHLMIKIYWGLQDLIIKNIGSLLLKYASLRLDSRRRRLSLNDVRVGLRVQWSSCRFLWSWGFPLTKLLWFICRLGKSIFLCRVYINKNGTWHRWKNLLRTYNHLPKHNDHSHSFYQYHRCRCKYLHLLLLISSFLGHVWLPSEIGLRSKIHLPKYIYPFHGIFRSYIHLCIYHRWRTLLLRSLLLLTSQKYRNNTPFLRVWDSLVLTFYHLSILHYKWLLWLNLSTLLFHSSRLRSTDRHIYCH